MDDIGCARFEPKSWDEFQRNLLSVGSEEHDYKTLVIDTADWVEMILHRAICEKFGKETLSDFDWGQGNAKAAKAWQWIVGTIQDTLDRKGMGCVVLAHARLEKFTSPEGPSYDRWVPDLADGTKGTPGARSLLIEWADEVFFGKYKEYSAQVDTKGKQGRAIGVGSGDRVVFTSERPNHIAKRHIEMPDELTFPKENGFAVYRSYWPTGQQQQTGASVASGDISGIVADGHSKRKEAAT